MIQNFDFHIHTKNSDGEYTIKEIIELLKINNINYFSITDHDNIDSIFEMQKIKTDLSYIPGIEFSGRFNGINMHILGYYLDGDLTNIKNLCNKIEELRKQRLYKLNEDLYNVFNIKIDNNEIDNIVKNNKSIGRPHLGKLLIKYGYVNNMKEAFSKYLNHIHTDIYYRLDAKVIIEAIKECGGIVLLAHPKKIEKRYKIDIDDILQELVNIGFDGIEVYNSLHFNNDSKRYIGYAKKYNLLISGGSDFHGPHIKPNVKLGYLNKEDLNKININDLNFYRKK